MPRKKHNVTPELIEKVRAMYEEVDDKGKKVWSQKRLSEHLGLPKQYITAFVNGFESHSEYRTHKNKQNGFSSYTDYLTHLAKKNGFSSPHEYRQHMARKNGFTSETQYRIHLAQENGFTSIYERRLHQIGKRGFNSFGEYQTHLVKKKGCSSSHEYRTLLAQEKGFESTYSYQVHLIQNSIFPSMHSYLDHLAKNNGFSSVYEYQLHLIKKKGFKSYSEYRFYLASKKGLEDIVRLTKTLRNNFNRALKKYTSTGKIQSASKYGIDYLAICESLEEEARQVYGKSISEMREEKYHVDHIIPVSFYGLEDPEEVRRCYHPSNLRWLSGEENMSRGNSFRAEDLEVLVNLPVEINPKKWLAELWQ